GPNLSRLAAKLKPEADKVDARRWLVQWLLNPNIHHPRTRMPYTHLEVAEACQVADWLLSQKADDWEGKDPATPGRAELVALTRGYLPKVPNSTREDVNKFLPADSDSPPGINDRPIAQDADESVLVKLGEGKDVDGALKWYIGKKSISRMGCYGCHDLPGF